MKKTFSTILALLLVSLLFGCAPNNNLPDEVQDAGTAVKTGMAVITTIEKSTDATAEKEGAAQVDSTVVALTIDNSGKIVKCKIDSAQTIINFNSNGKITTPLDNVFVSKQELGENYGMKKASGINKEWNEQANALASYVEGKTIDEVKSIAISEEGTPTDKELSSTVTMKIGGYISAIEKAAKNAKNIGAKASDKLGLGVITHINKSVDASDKDGMAQAYTYYAATTFGSDGKITSCIIDASQTNVNISSAGRITTDLKAPLETKNELGAKYGMKKASGIGKEWNEQAEAFAKYVIGKTADEVSGISLDEKAAPKDADLKSSVTVAIGEMIEVITKANVNAK